MNKFEQLIEYVINDEDQKARELFHDIIVSKSREIYESMMDADMGGDASDDLIDDVEMDEEADLSMEADESDNMDADMGDDMDADMGDDMGDDIGDDMGADMDADHHDDMGGNEELEDRVMDLEDKLDELMAEFEELMANDDMGDGMDADMGDDMGDDMGADMDDEAMAMAEGLSLKAAPKPVTSEEGNVNKKSTVAANAGARGAMAKPVHAGANEGGHHDSSAYRNATKDLGVAGPQDAAKGAFKSAAPKAVTTQASGVNAKSVIPGGRGQ
jgi:hypothetical protein